MNKTSSHLLLEQGNTLLQAFEEELLPDPGPAKSGDIMELENEGSHVNNYWRPSWGAPSASSLRPLTSSHVPCSSPSSQPSAAHSSSFPEASVSSWPLPPLTMTPRTWRGTSWKRPSRRGCARRWSRYCRQREEGRTTHPSQSPFGGQGRAGRGLRLSVYVLGEEVWGVKSVRMGLSSRMCV